MHRKLVHKGLVQQTKKSPSKPGSDTGSSTTEGLMSPPDPAKVSFAEKSKEAAKIRKDTMKARGKERQPV